MTEVGIIIKQTHIHMHSKHYKECKQMQRQKMEKGTVRVKQLQSG